MSQNQTTLVPHERFMFHDMNLWRNEFNSISENFLKSITHLIGLHFLNDQEKDCHNGYIMMTTQRRTYVYGETICRWLSLKHNHNEPQEIKLLDGKHIIQVDYGLDFFVILTDDGLVYLGSHEYWNTNKKLKLISNTHHRFKKIACGHEHLLLLRSDNKLMAMGWNGLGQITGTREHSHQLMIDTGLENIKKISCGWAHSLAMTNDGKLYAWGLNEAGQLGLNDKKDRNMPTLVTFADSIGNTKIKDFIGCAANSLFLMEDGTLFGCGWNENGELGSNDFDQSEPSPKKLPIENVLDIASGWSYRFTIAFTSDNLCYVWGELSDSQKLFQPTIIMFNKPLKSFAEVSALYFEPPLTFGWSKKTRSKIKFNGNFIKSLSNHLNDPDHEFVDMMVKKFSFDQSI